MKTTRLTIWHVIESSHMISHEDLRILEQEKDVQQAEELAINLIDTYGIRRLQRAVMMTTNRDYLIYKVLKVFVTYHQSLATARNYQRIFSEA